MAIGAARRFTATCGQTVRARLGRGSRFVEMHGADWRHSSPVRLPRGIGDMLVASQNYLRRAQVRRASFRQLPGRKKEGCKVEAKATPK